jgi:hypothetical protein
MKFYPIKLSYGGITVRFLEITEKAFTTGVRNYITYEIYLGENLVLSGNDFSPAPSIKNIEDAMAEFCSFLTSDYYWEEQENYVLACWAMSAQSEYLSLLAQEHGQEYNSEFLEILELIK